MAWRDRLRRRAAGRPDTAERPRRAGRTGAPVTAPSGAGPDPGTPGGSGSAAPVPSVPHDWDGGWRRTAAPELTLSRAPLGVSDGLTFRAGLAAWQNPSFDTGLGHALRPTAPTGLVRGVTRPAAAQPTHTGGGPLLLRALRPAGVEAPQGDGNPDAGTPAGTARTPHGRTPQVRPSSGREVPSGPSPSGPLPSAPVVRPSGGTGAGEAGSGAEPVVARPGGNSDNSAAGEGRSGSAPRTRGLTSGDSPAVLSSSPSPVQRAAAPGTAPVVTPADTGRPPVAREIPLVRRVVVLPGTAADGGVARSVSDGSASATRAGASGRDSGSASRPSAGSAGRTPSGPAARPAGAQSAGGGGQPEASRASGAEASDPAVRLRPVGPRLTVARRPAGPVRRIPALRPAATPATAGSAAPGASGPASAEAAPAGTGMPSTGPVQRAATRTASRAPLGAPLSELPATAAPAPHAAHAPQPPPGAGSMSGRTLPVVQRHPEGTAEGAAGTSRLADSGASGMAHGTSRPADSEGKGTAHGIPDGPAEPRRTPGPGRSGARVRGGLGAPLPALPPSADVTGSAAPGARAARPAPSPDVPRGLAHQDRGAGAAPAPSATDRDRTPGEAAPLRREEGGADAPLLGAVDVQRSLADQPTTAGTTSPRPTSHGDGPATPLVTPSPVGVPEGAAGTAGSAGNAPRSGVTSGGPVPGGQRPQGPGAPGPVVVARAMADGTQGSGTPAAGPPSAPAAPHVLGAADARPPGAADPRVLTATRSGAHSAPAALRSLQLLHARPLTVNTRAPEGVAQPAASRTGGRPVVAARWPGASAARQGEPAPPTGASARPSRSPSPSAGTPARSRVQRAATAHGPESSGVRSTSSPATPRVQRAATAYGPDNSGVRNTGSPGNVQRVPVVRPAPPGPETSGALARADAVPGRPLPVTAPQAPPLADRPPATSAPAPAPAPEGTVPVVRPRNVEPGPRPAAGGGGNSPTAPPVQRAVSGAGNTGSKGVPPKAAPARGKQQPSGTPTTSSMSAASGKRTAHRAEAPQDPGIDLDDLARRLLDPMARLLRTELRRGRERTGRPYDGRR
ncbi:hypothetical protein [Streptomyces diastatochromogenes]|uniref:Syndecan 1 n=1 Tax=Streptomyces diastatochromogenes TaxID=42236 RepID=A0A233SJE9_STRDA|nr:hypothetical protein [Streptomyces diastatochromogenes]OXY95762.1 hypothetical protein BEK98_16685 [Streptomyces diastatochromogenes]